MTGDKETNMSVIIVQVHTLLHAVSKYHLQMFQLLQKSPFSKAASPVRLINMLPWLQRYSEHQTAAILHDGFLHGFNLPSFKGTGCVVFENLRSILLHTDIV